MKKFRLSALLFAFLFSIQGCSLSQRSSSGVARIVIDSKTVQSLKRSSNGKATQKVQDPNYTYYLINVEGDGIPIIPGDVECLRLSKDSAVAISTANSGQTEVELKVPTGQNRRITIMSLYFDPLKNLGVRPPYSGELAMNYINSTGSGGDAGDPLIIAEAMIPDLRGDQVVDLWPLASPRVTQCQHGQQPIENADLRMTDYGPWMGTDASGREMPLRLWNLGSGNTFYFNLYGTLFNQSALSLTFGSSGLPAGVDSDISIYGKSLSSQAQINFRDPRGIDLSQTRTSMEHIINYTRLDGTSGTLSRSIPLDIADAPPVVIGTPALVPGTTNLYSVDVRADAGRIAEIQPLMREAVRSRAQMMGAATQPQLQMVPGPEPYQVSTFAGAVDSPQGIAVDDYGNVYALDYFNKVVKKWAPGGALLGCYDSKSIKLNCSNNTTDKFSDPNGTAVKNGYLYVADSSSIHKIAIDGSTTGNNEILVDDTYGQPMAVALDQSDNLYVATKLGVGSGYILKLHPDGSYFRDANNTKMIYGLITSNWDSGTPEGIAVDKQGQVYVADSLGDRILVFDSSLHSYQPLLDLFGIQGVAVDGAGSVYLAVTGQNNIQALEKDLSGNWVVHPIAGAASFNAPSAITVDSAGNLFVAEDNKLDENYRRITGTGAIRKLSRGCPVGGIAGNPMPLTLNPGTSCQVYYAVFSSGNLNNSDPKLRDSVILQMDVADYAANGAPRTLQSTLTSPSGGYPANNAFSTKWDYPLVYDLTNPSNSERVVVTSDSVLRRNTSGLYGTYFYGDGYSYEAIGLELKSQTDTINDLTQMDAGVFPDLNFPRQVNGSDLIEANLLVMQTNLTTTPPTVTYQSQHLDFLPLDLSVTQVNVQLSLKDVSDTGIPMIVQNSFIYTFGDSYLYSIDLSAQGRHLTEALSTNRYAQLVDSSGSLNTALYVENLAFINFTDARNNSFQKLVVQSILIDNLDSERMSIPGPVLNVSPTEQTPTQNSQPPF